VFVSIPEVKEKSSAEAINETISFMPDQVLLIVTNCLAQNIRYHTIQPISKQLSKEKLRYVNTGTNPANCVVMFHTQHTQNARLCLKGFK